MGEPHPMVEDMAKRTAKASRAAIHQSYRDTVDRARAEERAKPISQLNAEREQRIQRNRKTTADYMMHRARQQADAQDRRERG